MMYGKKETYQELLKRRAREKAIKDAKLNKLTQAKATAQRGDRVRGIQQKNKEQSIERRANQYCNFEGQYTPTRKQVELCGTKNFTSTAVTDSGNNRGPSKNVTDYLKRTRPGAKIMG